MPLPFVLPTTCPSPLLYGFPLPVSASSPPTMVPVSCYLCFPSAPAAASALSCSLCSIPPSAIYCSILAHFSSGHVALAMAWPRCKDCSHGSRNSGCCNPCFMDGLSLEPFCSPCPWMEWGWTCVGQQVASRDRGCRGAEVTGGKAAAVAATPVPSLG